MEVIVERRSGTAQQIRAGEILIAAVGNRWILPSEEHLDWFLRIGSIRKLNEAGELTIRKVASELPSEVMDKTLSRSQFLELAEQLGVPRRDAEAALTSGSILGARKVDNQWVIPFASANDWTIQAALPTDTGGEEE